MAGAVKGLPKKFILTITTFLTCFLFSVPMNKTFAQSASPGDNLIVCGNSNWGGLNQLRTQAMRDKLSNATYFGLGGSYSESSLSFTVIGLPTTTNLAANSCNIWFSGYDNDGPYNDLSTFVANGGVVIGSCDTVGFDGACTGLGVSVINYSNTDGGYNSTSPINPIACDGGAQNLSITLLAAGGASSYFSSGVSLARYTDGSNLPLIITDSITSPSYIMTGDIDLFTTENSNVTSGSLVISDQDKFIVNTFKYAVDKVTGLLAINGGPSCGKITIIYSADISKTVDTINASSLPTTLNYTINVDNTGTGALDNPALNDTLFQDSNSLTLTTGPSLVSGDTNADGVLDASETWTYSATYTLTQSNLDDARPITNSASFTADLLSVVNSNPVTTTLTSNPSFIITKEADKTTDVAAGETIIYTYTVTNTGNQTITNVNLNDDHGGSGPAPVAANEILLTDNLPLSDSSDSAGNGVWDSLAPGDVVTFTGSYLVTQEDVDTLQ